MATSSVPERVLHRLGRLPDPLAWTPEQYTGSGRFDDPLHAFRVLYAAADRLTCCIELVAAFRSPQGPARSELVRALAALTPSALTDTVPPAGRIPTDWRVARAYAALSTAADQSCLDLRTPEGLETARQGLGLADLDLGDVLHHQRPVTQRIARWAYERDYSAIVYPSRLAARSECWALFDTARFVAGQITYLSADDPDLMRAADLLGLTIES